MPKEKKIQRFPRDYAEYPMAIPSLQHLTVNKRAKAILAMGLQPKRWRTLTPRMKKLIKLIIAGSPINEALKKHGVSTTTYYRWLNGHRLFREYFRKHAQNIRENAEMRLDGNLGRAIRVVEETLGSRDPYLAYNAAEKLLTGRGKYRRSTDIQKDVKSTIQVQEAIDVSHHLDSNTTKLFIEALLGQAKGLQAPAEQPRIIDVKVLKELPPPQGTSEEQQAKTG